MSDKITTEQLELKYEVEGKKTLGGTITTGANPTGAPIAGHNSDGIFITSKKTGNGHVTINSKMISMADANAILLKGDKNLLDLTLDNLKFALGQTRVPATGEIAGNKDVNITLTGGKPEGKEILGCFIIGYTPSKDWATELKVHGVQSSSLANFKNGKFACRTVGGTSQYYTVRTVWVYR